MSPTEELLSRARAFAAADPDPATRAELEASITRAEVGDTADLEDRFRGPLEFGTAGLRGIIGAGESRMNRAVVARATHGLISYVLRSVPSAAERGVVIGRDGRRMSAEFQRDAAEIALGLGVRVFLIGEVAPTPVTAFAVKHFGAAAGVMITASHNPPAYNGYKVYWENGAQIIPPLDAGIAAEIAAAGPANRLPRLALEDAGERLVDATAVIDRYVDAAGTIRSAQARVDTLVIAYSALHGVGERTFRRTLASRGFTQIHSVAEQAEPDGAFPTVQFPNPEEPGALDRVLALAARVAADVVLVNDPDADRLGVAVRGADGGYTVLNGNEIGVLLGHHLLARGGASKDALVIATIVSSQLLRRVAAGLGARYAETLTGFKWIANEAIRLERAEGLRFVFGYEEALGYTVGTLVRDKDGITAALVMAELAALLKSEGRTLLDELTAIRRRFGFLVSRQKSVTLPGRDGAEKIARAMERVRRERFDTLAGETITSVRDLAAESAAGDVVVLSIADGGRIAVRPSGTEPKIKLYFEVVETLAEGEAPAAAETRGHRRLDALVGALLELAGLV